MTQLLVIGFLKAIRGKSLSKNKPTCETPLHRRSMEVTLSGLWAPGMRRRDHLEYNIHGTTDLAIFGFNVHTIPDS